MPMKAVMGHLHRSRMWLAVAVINAILQTTGSQLFERHLNPEIYMTTFEVIQYWGYPSEEYEVLTDDGYFVQVNRIPYGLHSPVKKGHNPPVLLVAGLFSLNKLWVSNTPKTGLGFVLADAGYDVWMLNCRGTTWTRKHVNLSIEEEEFWNFSFHEMAIYDIPAVIEFILTKTKHEQLYFIGQSQGGSLALITFSVLPKLAKKVKLIMLFAPTYTLVGTTSLGKLGLLIPDAIKWFFLGTKEFVALPKVMKIPYAEMCTFPLIDRICHRISSLSMGNNEKNQNLSRIDVFVANFPDYTSVKTVVHLGQVARSAEFKYFDYGRENIKVYNMTTPPLYNLEGITVPTALWSVGVDPLTDLKDIELLIPRLTQLVFYKHIQEWTHGDFMMGLDGSIQLYPDIFWLMEQYK